MHKEMVDIEKINISINVMKNVHLSKKSTYSKAWLKISFKAWLPGLCIIICRLLFCKFVIDAIKYCVSGLWRYGGMGKGIKYSQDQSNIMLLFEHNFRHNAVNFFDGYDQKQNAQIFGHNVSNPIAGVSLIFVHFFAVITRLRRETA